MQKYLYDFKNDLRNRRIFVCFNGPVSQDLMAELGDALKRKMKSEHAGRSKVMSVFSVLVEQAQNIIRYSAEKVPGNNPEENAKEVSQGIIMVGREGNDRYFVLCGNMVESGQVEPLREKLTILQDMSQDELRKYYKEQRRKKPDARSKGAGLGFIEVARKAGKQLYDRRTGMDDLKIKAEKYVPGLCFDSKNNIFDIKGDSYPENTTELYAPVFVWLKIYLGNLKKNREIIFNIELRYFNSSPSTLSSPFNL